jgi:hypothetical protein
MSDDARKTCRFQQKPKRIANRVVIVDNKNGGGFAHSTDYSSELRRLPIYPQQTTRVVALPAVAQGTVNSTGAVTFAMGETQLFSSISEAKRSK